MTEKVQTRTEIEIAVEAGFEYFQGHFFSTAELFPKKELWNFHKDESLPILSQASN